MKRESHFMCVVLNGLIDFLVDFEDLAVKIKKYEIYGIHLCDLCS